MKRALLIPTILAMLIFAAVGPDAKAVCASQQLQSYLGDWDFTTVVLGAKKSSAIGVNGYYRMHISANGCDVQVVIAKLGFTNVMFARNKIQYGKASIRTYTVKDYYEPAGVPSLLVDADLGSDSGTSLSVGFTFVGDQGFWRYLGSSWDAAGMWGALQTNRIASLEDAFSMPKKMTCNSYRLGGSDPTAVAFACPGLLIATPALDKALWNLPRADYESGKNWFDKVAAVGAENGGWIDYCHTHREGMEYEQYSSRVYVDGGRIRIAEASDASARRCGVKPAVAPNRWGGGVK